MPLLLALIRPYLLHIVAGLAVMALVGGGYAYIRHQGAQAARNEAFKREVAAYKEQAEKANQIALGLEATLTAIKSENNKLNERLKNEQSKSPVYRSCRLPAGGVRIFSDARAGIPTR